MQKISVKKTKKWCKKFAVQKIGVNKVDPYLRCCLQKLK